MELFHILIPKISKRKLKPFLYCFQVLQYIYSEIIVPYIFRNFMDQND